MKRILALLLALVLLCGAFCSCQGNSESVLFSSIEHSDNTLRYPGIDFLITEEEFLKILPEAAEYEYYSRTHYSDDDFSAYTKTLKDPALDAEVSVNFIFYHKIFSRVEMYAKSSDQDESKVGKRLVSCLKKQLPELYEKLYEQADVDSEAKFVEKLTDDTVSVRIDDSLLLIGTYSDSELNETTASLELYSNVGQSFHPGKLLYAKDAADEFLADPEAYLAKHKEKHP